MKKMAAAVLALAFAACARAQDPEPSIHPLCLWEHPKDNMAVEDCQKRHAPDRVEYREGYFISPLKDEFNPSLPDEIRSLPVGKLSNGDEVFLVGTLRYGDRIDGTQVLIWRKAGMGPGGIQILASSGFRSQGGITGVAILPEDRIQVGINFDTAWKGIDSDWAGLPPGWDRSPAFAAGCGTCGMGIAHVIFPDAGRGRPVLGSIELDAIPETDGCRSGKVRDMARYLPHAFTPDQFQELIRRLKECPAG